MAASLRDVFGVLNSLVEEGVVERYAVVGAMAVLFYAEPSRTYDIDVAVALPERAGTLLSLAPLYEWLAGKGFDSQAEHLMIHGVPVQFLPGDSGLWGETVLEARQLSYEGEPVWVAAPEYLVALARAAPSPKRRERAAMLMESGQVDEARLRDILARHGLA